jgi:streptogramin lyase
VGFSNPTGIALGSDGNLWFTHIVGPKGPEAPARPLIGRITPNGVITEFPIHVANSMPGSITKGPDGNLWFTDEATNSVGRVSITTGQVTEFPLNSRPGDDGSITTGPDGNLWVTETSATKVARVTTTGTVTEFSAPFLAPVGIVTGPDSRLWLTELGGATGGPATGTMTPTGTVFANYSLGTANKAPAGITVGPDNRLWFTEVMGGTTANGFQGAIGAITAF